MPIAIQHPNLRVSVGPNAIRFSVGQARRICRGINRSGGELSALPLRCVPTEPFGTKEALVCLKSADGNAYGYFSGTKAYKGFRYFACMSHFAACRLARETTNAAS